VPTGHAVAPAFGTLLRESLVVLTHDPGLIAAVRAVAPAEHELIFVGAEAELANHLIADSAGVVVLDTAATVNSIAQLTQRLKAQFPDLVLVVTGGATEQAALSAQVTSGNVYRFLHKPASEQRIRLFIDAAWRRRASGETTATTSTLAQPGKPAAARRLPLGTLATVVVSIAVAAGLVGWWLGQHPTQKISAAPPAGVPARVPPPRPVPSDAALNPLLERANEAFARGDWLLPPGNSAAELYRQALEHHPGDAQALAGLDKVVDQVLSAAEQDLLGQHLDEAEHLTAAARAIAPNSVRVSFLATQVTHERERATRVRRRALQLQQQQTDERERQQEQLIAVARAALTAGNLDEAARSITSGCGRWRRSGCHRQADARPAGRTARRSAPARSSACATSRPSIQRARARNGTSGWVDLAFNVESDGSVANVAVLASDPKNVFDQAAIAALRKWRYRPVERDGTRRAARAAAHPLHPQL
jgi:protein TonB